MIYTNKAMQHNSSMYFKSKVLLDKLSMRKQQHSMGLRDLLDCINALFYDYSKLRNQVCNNCTIYKFLFILVSQSVLKTKDS